MGNIDLTAIIQAVIALIAALVTCYVIPWIKARTTDQQRDYIRGLIRALVYAAEQIYGAGKGEEKLQYVCEQLRERGYEVDLSEIEASVYDAFNRDKGLFALPAMSMKAEADREEPAEAPDVEDDLK